MKKLIIIALVSLLSVSAAFANDDKGDQASKKEAKIEMTKESMKLIKKERKKTSKIFREKNLFC